MSDQVQVAALHDQRLVLITPSAALATRLRMDSAELLKALRASSVKDVSQIYVRTAPLPRMEKTRRRKRQLPEIGRLSLERFAKDSGDKEIETIVQRSNSRITDDS